MKMGFVLWDGTEVTSHEIRQAYVAGQAVIVHAYNRAPSLMLNGREYDHRDDGSCYQIAEKTWTSTPGSSDQCLTCAYYD